MPTPNPKSCRFCRLFRSTFLPSLSVIRASSPQARGHYPGSRSNSMAEEAEATMRVSPQRSSWHEHVGRQLWSHDQNKQKNRKHQLHLQEHCPASALYLPRPHQPARRNSSRHCSKAQWKEKYNCLSHPSGQAGQSTRTNTSKGKSRQMLEMSRTPNHANFARRHIAMRPLSQEHISQPVAIGLDTARKLSGRRSTICLSHPSGQAGKSTRTNTSKGKSRQMLEMSRPRDHATSRPIKKKLFLNQKTFLKNQEKTF